MRFARQAKRSPEYAKIHRNFIHPLSLVTIAYNVVWWVPLVLAVFAVISYHAGFVGFFILTAIRLLANLYRNNILSGTRAANFPLRQP